MFHNHNETRV